MWILQIDFIYVIIASHKNGCNKKAHLAAVQIGRSSYEERAAYVRSVYTNPSDRGFQELDDQLVHAVRAAALQDESIQGSGPRYGVPLRLDTDTAFSFRTSSSTSFWFHFMPCAGIWQMCDFKTLHR
jgi:hypothetical protein